MKKLALILSMFFILGSFLVLRAGLSENKPQEKSSDNTIVTVKPIPPVKSVSPGDTFELALELIIAPSYHINSQKPEDELLVPTSVEFKKDSVFEVKEIIFPEAKKKKFKFSDKLLSVYEGQTKVKIKIELAEDFCGSNLDIEGKIRYQACDDQACLRPTFVPFKVKIPISSD